MLTRLFCHTRAPWQPQNDIDMQSIEQSGTTTEELTAQDRVLVKYVIVNMSPHHDELHQFSSDVVLSVQVTAQKYFLAAQVDASMITITLRSLSLCSTPMSAATSV